MARTGRTRLNGSGARPRQYTRLAISYDFKLRVVTVLDSAPMSEVVEHFFPGLSTEQSKRKKRFCYSWKQARENIEAKCAGGARHHHRDRGQGIGTTLSPVVEEQLVRLANDLRADGVPVIGLMLKLQAQELYASSGGRPSTFAASWSWRQHFLRRHKLVIRKRTREGQTTPANTAVVAAAFSTAVLKTMQELQVIKAYNVDQTAVNYEYMPTSTVSARGAKTVWIKCAGKTKDRVTVMLLGDSDGNKCDPFLIFKARPSTSAETQRENEVIRHGFGRQLWKKLSPHQHGVQLYANSAGWRNSELSIRFLFYHFGQRSNMHGPVLLLWDDFSGHWREDVVIFARLINVELLRVPAGYAYACQPADLAWNRPLKERMRKQWIDFLVAQVRSVGAGVPFRMAPPQRVGVLHWIKSAWAGLATATIVGGFARANIKSLTSAPLSDDAEYARERNETDWGSSVRLLRETSAPISELDPSRDIEDLEAVEDVELGASSGGAKKLAG